MRDPIGGFLGSVVEEDKSALVARRDEIRLPRGHGRSHDRDRVAVAELPEPHRLEVESELNLQT